MKYIWQSFILLLLSLLLLPATHSSYPLPPPSPPLHVSYYHTNNGICCRVHLCVSWYVSDVYLLVCSVYLLGGGGFYVLPSKSYAAWIHLATSQGATLHTWCNFKCSLTLSVMKQKTEKLNTEMLSSLNVRHMTVVKNIRAGQGIWVMC